MRRQSARQPIVLGLALASGILLGIGYRAAFGVPAEHSLANFVRSGLHGGGLALVIWAVQAGFARGARTSLGLALRRFPLVVELLVRALVMTTALVVGGLLLQAVLYAGSQHLAWAKSEWFAVDLPRIVALAFVLSLVIGACRDVARLVGAPLLTSLVLGTYLRPAKRRMIVMFLDLAESTRLAETLGEVRVHDLITRFFFDIDGPIADLGGTVHAYVGDEVIASWPIEDDPALNARALACVFAIERKMAVLAPAYQAEFGVTPSFRAGIHAGPVVVSECGESRRQLAYFGDTMNVTARLCDHCKAVNGRLVVSGDLLRIVRAGDVPAAQPPQLIALRGRQAPVEAIIVTGSAGPVA